MTRDFIDLMGNYIDPAYSRFWQGAILEKIEVYKNRALWKLYVSVSHAVHTETQLQTADSLLRHFSFLESLEIIPLLENQKDELEIIIAQSKNDFLSEYINYGQINNTIQWQIENNRIDLITGDSNLFSSLLEREICEKLSNWFWQEYRLRVLVRVLCTALNRIESSNTEFISRKKVEVMEIEDDTPPQPRRVSRKERKGSALLEKGQLMKISEIEEGLRSAVVEGEIWGKDTNVLKDGRCVISYYLSDYADTIIIKSFVDKTADDKIEPGDWVRVCGSVRYDDYVREIVLFMDSYMALAKPERMDNYPEKRVELHAHTKMSAMDGLTEIDQLVERAARWQHPAIAITDHGCAQAFPDAYQAARKHNIKLIYGVEAYLIEEDKKESPCHIVLLAKNQTGLRNLYKLVSISYLDYFYRKPKISRTKLIEHRDGLLLGTACEAGELYQAVIKQKDKCEIEKIASFYDYLEIQPLKNNEFLIKDGRVKSIEELKNINRFIFNLGKKLDKPVVATGDVHFLDPHHEIFRRIIQAGQGYDDAESQAPLYFRTTDEMLEEFAYLGEKEAREAVIDNSLAIAAEIADIKPVPDGFYPPKIETADEEVSELSWKRAHCLYGEELPDIIGNRLIRELDSLTGHGFSVLYLIAHKLVKKSNEDGYLVGSRGSVGSSLVAYLIGVTEVNPMEPHYLCSACQYSEFILDASAGCGADLPDRTCPVCGEELSKEGFDIPFETFLGFEGDKVPDIDLNFSGDYQGRAHKYVEELFGSENVFRAGTISTIAEKTAYGFVKNYAGDREIVLKNSEINRLVKGITGVRRTTGQHPGGLIVVPKDRDILEFTPLQHPADNKESGVITTHFEYHAIGDQLVKLDILGHDDPTVIKELEDLTGINASGISLSEKETMKLFSGVEPLGVTEKEIVSAVGTCGIPEFGTRFVRQMLEATRPTTFSELVRISGLSHGTNVWLNNAQTLIASQTASLSQVICTRDDIMIHLIQQGMDKKLAFKIMEKVRKGKKLNTEEVKLMQECNIPQWYIDSCNKIEYMFPKAHAVAYVMMAFRIAYFKVYYPLAFYASFFSIRAEDFDAETILRGYDSVRQRIREIDKMAYSASQKDKKLLPILELAMEMYARKFIFHPVDIYNSDASKFVIYENGLLLPFSALPNVGLAAAQGIVDSRTDKEFISVEDFQQRTHLNKTGMDILRKNNCFKDLPETTQISLFG